MNKPQRWVLIAGGLLELAVVWFGLPFSPLIMLVRIVGVAVATSFIWMALHALPGK